MGLLFDFDDDLVWNWLGMSDILVGMLYLLYGTYTT